MFKRILIANRGEIACRIIRTCKRLGVETVAIYSDADANAQHVKQATVAYHCGGSAPSDSYLRGERIIAIARESGAQAIHPGFGFLSENADFVDAVERAGLKFIGPHSASMRKMGSKAGAKELMAAAGVPVVPGYTGEDQNPARLQQEAERVGFPLMIKAAHGGGGKGMRIVQDAQSFIAALESCQREALGAFGKDRVLLERYIATPRHIEFQIFGDQHGRLRHLNERECSVQRRYQKIIEEAPSPRMSAQLRERMGEAAVLAGKAIDYVNAGTVEFIVGPDDDFYFMEINTRLQVEHPVTEMTIGADLVEWQLQVAAGFPLPCADQPIVCKGHAIEVRLYAEDPENNFLPGSGRLDTLRLPTISSDVRIDSGVIQGDVVSIFYDPMIAKMIVWAPHRDAAILRLREALATSVVDGPKSNIGFLETLLQHPKFVAGEFDTSFLDRNLASVLAAREIVAPELLALAFCALAREQEQQALMAAQNSKEPNSPWKLADAWRVAHAGKRTLKLRSNNSDVLASLHGHADTFKVEFDGHSIALEYLGEISGVVSYRVNSMVRTARVILLEKHVVVHDGCNRFTLLRMDPFGYSAAAEATSNLLRAPMPGRIVSVKTALDKTVEQGDELLIMEAMKMELTLRAPMSGKVHELRAIVGEFVEADFLLVRLEPSHE
jgi:3-methylcrotonyl-CoA carboxylase alpha subunit